MNYDCVNLGVAVVATVIAIGAGVVCCLQRRKISALKAQADSLAAKQSEQDAAIEKLANDQTEYQSKIEAALKAQADGFAAKQSEQDAAIEKLANDQTEYQSKIEAALKAQADGFAAKQSEQDAAIEKLANDQTEYQNKIKLSFDEFTLRSKAQMFLHEGNLLNEKGEWVLENNGEKKIFKPAKIQAAVSADKAEESVFKYTDSEVICTTTVKGQIKSELIFSIAGAPKAGKIFENGKVIKEFYYNELGQVIEK